MTSSSTPIEPHVWRTAWTVLIGALAVLFDTTIVSVALNTLTSDLHTSVSTIQWVSTGYLLALGVAIPITGWAQRVIGGKRLWLIALVLFLVGSVLCSLATTAPELIVFRAIQGVGGGIIIPLMSTLIMQAAGGKGLGRIMSVISLPAVLGPIFGPLLGGVILEHLHWSWMFWVNVPFCVVALVAAVRVLPPDGPVRRARFDTTGFVLMAPGLVALLWGLSNAGKPGGFGRADVLVQLVVGLVLLVGFTAWALRRRSRALLDLALLTHRPLAAATTLMFVVGATLYGSMLLLPLYFQQARGASVLMAGLLLVPQGVGTLLSRSSAGTLSDRVDSRLLVGGGFIVCVIGTVPFAFAGAHTNIVVLMVALLIRGVGLGLVTVPLMALGYRGLSHEEIPDASVMTRISQQVGGSFGTAVLAVILAAAAGGVDARFQQAFWWTVGFTVVGAVVALALPASDRRRSASTEPAHESVSVE